MILLCDRYSQESQDLQASLQSVGQETTTVVIEADGFLPEGVLSPFTYFVEERREGDKPLYFNQVPVPDFWEIAGDNQSASISKDTVKKAHIAYADAQRPRLVKQVDWYNEVGQVRQSDHYHRYGYRYAQTTYAVDGSRIFTRYVTRQGQERILENHVTGDILLTLENQPLQHFKNRIAFVQFFLRQLDPELKGILFNTLATPFLVSFYLPEKTGRDVLIWQEPLGDEIPGNMQLVLEDNDLRANTVVIPDRATYERALELTPVEQHHKIFPLGYHYQFKRDNHVRKDTLIVTNSDQIEQLETIVASLPDVTFRIAAVTEMSSKLTSMMAYPNVILYQNASQQQIEELYQLSDVYLDINYANELLHAVRRAFDHNLVIFAFEETAHNRTYLAPENTFTKDNLAGLLDRIQLALASVEGMTEVLIAQGRHANYMDADSCRLQFEEIIGEQHG